MNRSLFALAFLPLLVAPLAAISSGADKDASVLPGTQALTWSDEDPSVRIMDGAHAFVDRKIAEAAAKTPALPLAEGARDEAIARSRAALARKLGVVDPRESPAMEFFSADPVSFEGEPAGSKVADGPGFSVHAVRWPVLPGFRAEGLYVNPAAEGDALPAPPLMVLLPDADDSPEDLLGMTNRLEPKEQIGLRFALAGFRLLIPALLDRGEYRPDTGDEAAVAAIARTRQSRREWIYRQAFQMGRHPLGYDIQTLLAGVDWFEASFPGNPVRAAGHGEGGRAALYAAALDTRIDGAFVSGAFAPRDAAWAEPIHRNLFGLLPEHGDASVAALISPRVLLVEHTDFPGVSDQKGELVTPPFSEVEREWGRVAEALGGFGAPPSFFLTEAHDGARGDFPSVAGFLQATGLARSIDRTAPLGLVVDLRPGFDSEARQARLLAGLESHVQRLVDGSESVRDEFFFYAAEPALRRGSWSTLPEHPTLDPKNFIARGEEWRRRFEEELIGVFDEELAPPNPRTRKLKETAKWTMWEVGLDVYPEFEAWGVLLMPKGIPAGEKRAVVVCQHGRNGLPRDCIDAGKTAYNDFAATLADRGYITYAPHNLYRGEDRYRWLDRKANLVGASLFSFLAASHRQHLAWLHSLAEVDPTRIAFYGLSYGGESAMRLPAMIPDYALSICSGDFNQWTRKVADPDFPGTFMQSVEWEMPYWNLGQTYDYAEMAALIFPRPFFVERGRHDRVSTDSWVAHEYAEAAHLYARFGLSDRIGIEFFHGGHSIHLRGSLEFLERHLGKP